VESIHLFIYICIHEYHEYIEVVTPSNLLISLNGIYHV